MRTNLTLAALVALGLAFIPRSARADDSTRGPFYVQGMLGSFSVWTELPLAGTLGYWHPDVEFGYHVSGRHDGFVIGLRQAFDVGRDHYALGETLLRGGYDLAFPFRDGRFEVTVAPFATFGLNYFFDGPEAGVHFSAGLDAKLFFFRGVYLLVRPIELGAGQFVNLGFGAKNVYFNLNAGIGAGCAF
jgi:hypothetical protein